MLSVSGEAHRPVPQRPTVRGENVWLRPLDEQDLEAHCDAVNEHEPGWWAGFPGALAMRQVEQWFERVQERHGNDGYWFAISPLGSDDFLGEIWLWEINRRFPGAEVSIFVAKPGRGVGRDAITAVVDYGFATVGLPRIWGFTADHNTRSLRSFESCGFVVEGRMRGANRHNGNWNDNIQFSMTFDDWKQLERPRSWDLNQSGTENESQT
jgi:RimJ/RimL family protein N-acetyltransferase